GDVRSRIWNATGIPRVKWLDDLVQRLTTFGLVTVAWLFFRANNAKDAMYMMVKLPHAITDALDITQHRPNVRGLYISGPRLTLSFLAIIILEIVHAIQKKGSIDAMLQRQPRALRWCIYYFVVFSIIYFGVFYNRQFIYFQF